MSAEVVGGWRIVREIGPSGLMFATSPDYRGLLAAGRSEEELTQNVADAVAELHQALAERCKPPPAV